MNLEKKKIDQFVKSQNSKKVLLTPGPASLLTENIIGLEPSFGRGDESYDKIEKQVLNKLKKISGHNQIVRLQGAASFALEIMVSNFLYGKVLIIKTGIYSDRLHDMSLASKKYYKKIKKIEYVDWDKLDKINKKFDWVVGCYVETSIGLKVPIEELYILKKRLKSKLAIDATASIGLEKNHKLADVIGYSSCKGLFGLTGGAFIAFNKLPKKYISLFNLNLFNHLEKKMTGPYHAICSLKGVLNKYQKFKYSVQINKKKIMKKMKNNLVFRNKNQPLLCTQINKKVFSKDKKVIFYKSREDIKGSIVCHLGEVHLKKKAKGNIIDNLYLK
jgi:aspartate aminotransferase-like enzyme